MAFMAGRSDARAFLSARYRRIDNYDVVGIVTPVVGEMPEVQFESCELTEDFCIIVLTETAVQSGFLLV